jgi:hypothetical protein
MSCAKTNERVKRSDSCLYTLMPQGVLGVGTHREITTSDPLIPCPLGKFPHDPASTFLLL